MANLFHTIYLHRLAPTTEVCYGRFEIGLCFTLYTHTSYKIHLTSNTARLRYSLSLIWVTRHGQTDGSLRYQSGSFASRHPGKTACRFAFRRKTHSGIAAALRVPWQVGLGSAGQLIPAVLLNRQILREPLNRFLKLAQAFAVGFSIHRTVSAS